MLKEAEFAKIEITKTESDEITAYLNNAIESIEFEIDFLKK